MSAAKMVADSTQSDLVTEKPTGTKRRKSSDKKKNKKQKKSASKKSGKKKHEDENDSDLDLEKKVLPIGDYIKDRPEMLDQMFHCLKGGSLHRTLPEVLKELPLDNLKQRCLEQLEVMSRKRIRRILGGDDPATISSSGTEESSEEEQEQDEPEESMTVPDSQGVDPTLQVSGTGDTDSGGDVGSDWEQPEVEEGELGSDGEEAEMEEKEGASEGEEQRESESEAEESEMEDQEQKEEEEEEEEGEIAEEEEGSEVEQRISPSPIQGPIDEHDKKEDEDKPSEMSDHHDNAVEYGEVDEEVNSKGDNQEELESMDIGGKTVESVDDEGSSEDNKSSSDQTSVPLESLAPFLTQNQMELLELEMRARAIKSMLRSQEPKT